MTGTARIIRGNALALPLDDESVDLVVTSPPFFGLRSYQDDGKHYDGQIGAEATPTEFVDALIAATAEMVRVLKPSGSIWVNLGDKYQATSFAPQKRGKDASGVERPTVTVACERCGTEFTGGPGRRFCSSFCGGSDNSPRAHRGGVPVKSLIGIPWRYAIRAIDDLGLILRRDQIWSKPNGLPESVTDRCRSSHEYWFHFVKQPRYYSAVDEIREPHLDPAGNARYTGRYTGPRNPDRIDSTGAWMPPNPLGKLPGSVWEIPTSPLTVPDHLGVDHYAAFPLEWPRRIIRGWSPSGVCTACGEGRRPVATAAPFTAKGFFGDQVSEQAWNPGDPAKSSLGISASDRRRQITGYACACPDTTAPTTPGVILDPFGGTGTTALAAKALGRHGISIDMSADYCRLATWRTTDPGQLASALQVDKPAPVAPDQLDLLEGLLA